MHQTLRKKLKIKNKKSGGFPRKPPECRARRVTRGQNRMICILKLEVLLLWQDPSASPRKNEPLASPSPPTWLSSLSEKGISVSAYIERIVLERDWQKQQALETKK